MLTIAWSVYQTTAPPVSRGLIDTLLSADNGEGFLKVLSAGTTSDGSQAVAFPAVLTSNGRIRVEAHNNTFFVIFNADSSISVPV